MEGTSWAGSSATLITHRWLSPGQPPSVAVIGFDNLDEAQYSLPSLTTVDPGREEIAETAVRILLERIADKTGEQAPRELFADFSIVERESTGQIG